MFSLVVIGVAAGVFVMYFRHEREMKRRRLAARNDPNERS